MPTNMQPSARRPWKNALTGLLLTLLVSFVASALVAVLIVRDHRSGRQAERRDRQLSELYRDVSRADDRSLLAAVYACEGGGEIENVPCPDYTAKVRFQGDAENTPPMLEPAVNTKGDVVIDLTAKWYPATCSGQSGACDDKGNWEVTAKSAASVTLFAENQLRDERWDGPRYVGFSTWPTHSYMGEVTEFYAADKDRAIVGKPLSKEHAG